MTRKRRDHARYFETHTVHAGDKVNVYLLEKIRADRALSSPAVITWAAPAVPSLDDPMFAGSAIALSPADACAYERYVHLVAMSGVTPWSVEQWWAETKGKVDYAFRRWARLSRVDSNERDEMTGSAAPKLGVSKRHGWMIGHVKEQCSSVQVGKVPQSRGEGEWTKDWQWEGPGDDTLISVRPQTESVIGEGVSPLTSRVCRHCKQHLPATRFAKKRNTIREVCKSCDNARRRQQTKT